MSALKKFAHWLTPRRLRAQALLLALAFWTTCAIDYATPGPFDRAHNIKFQDFLQFPIAARLIAQGRAADLYKNGIVDEQIRAIVGNTNVHLDYFYGPQVALPFLPLRNLPFLAQAAIWITFSLLIYLASIHLLLQSSPALKAHRSLVAISSAAYPPLFHFFVRGQLSAIVLLFFTAAALAFLARKDFLAGLALGCLVFKPQFLVAIPLIFLLAQAWKILAGLALSAAAQAAFTFLYFGPVVTRPYLATLLLSAAQPRSTELDLSPIQMHSLHAFWSLLIPWPQAVFALYLLSSLIVIALAARIWKSSHSPQLKFSALILAAILVNPHLYIYDLLALVPAFFLLADWSFRKATPQFQSIFHALLYLAFVLPLLGPLSRWTHLQLSVLAFAALLWILYRLPIQPSQSLSS